MVRIRSELATSLSACIESFRFMACFNHENGYASDVGVLLKVLPRDVP